MNQANGWIDRNATRLTMLAIVGTCVCFVAFGYLLVQNGKRASEGSRARERQQMVYPVSVLIYEDAERRGVINARQLACFKDSRQCPPITRKRP